MRVPFLLVAFLTPSIALCQVGSFQPTSSPISPAGVRAVVDLPTSRHMRNTGGRDGAGLCVFTSITMAADWCNLIDLLGYRAWMEQRPGGGYPQKVDTTLAQYCREKGIPVPKYVQHTGGDDAFLDLAIRTGRCPCVTYAGSDDFYKNRRGQPVGIDHMVCLAHLDQDSTAIIDNNRPGNWVWMTRSEFLTRWRARGGGWAFVFLNAPPPPYNGRPTSTRTRIALPGCDCHGEPCDYCGPGCRCIKPTMIGQCANGQCPNGRCPLVPSISPFGRGTAEEPIGSPPSDRHEWGLIPGIGYGWRFKLTPVEAPPVQAPPENAGDPFPTGVISDKIHEHPAYSISGRESTRDEVHDLLLADDSNHWHLSAVGDPSFLARVKADVDQLPPETRAKLLVQAYQPTAWQVGQFGLVAGVTLRKPPTNRISVNVGSISSAEYTAAKLSDLLGDAAGPNPRPAPPPPAVDPSPVIQAGAGVPPWCCVAGAGLLYLFMRRK